LRFRRTDRPMKALFTHFVGRVLVLVRTLGPYAAIELLLPGGTVLALLYWWHRHRVRSLRAISKDATSLEVKPINESLSAQNPVRTLREAVFRTSARSGASRPIARNQPPATALSPCRSLAA
jgi:hypothetical protein